MSRSKFLYKIIPLVLVTMIICVAALMIGSVGISLSNVWNAIVSGNTDATSAKIIFEIRLPRVMLAVAVGGGLSVAGAVFQAILMNPLAEPYILGISSGGTFGAVLSFVLGLSFIGTQMFAFAGSAAVIFLVFVLGKRRGELEPNVLLLTGVMVGAFFSAAILFLMSFLNDSLRSAVFWLIGSLSIAGKTSAYYVLPLSVVISFILSLNGYKYNVLSLGSDNARHLGINVGFVKNMTYILGSIMVGAIVSVSGIVGFVGLLVPHACRMIYGSDNRIIIPGSFFAGASYMVITDTIARSLIAPAELPVGAVTALLGAPVFIYLLRKRFTFPAG